MGQAAREEIYPLKRDKEESARLNDQHAFLVDLFGGNQIHPSIPKDRLFDIADIATGTGIWLQDVSKLLKDVPADRPRYYHGFDISAEQFPSDPGELHFSIQDVLKPFPPEHLNRYDLVHVRLLVGALREEEFKEVVANVATLLKPGGYLQWDEIDSSTLIIDPNRDKHPTLTVLGQLMLDFMKKSGCTLCAPARVLEGCQAAGLSDVTRHDYHTDDRPELRDRTRAWLRRVFQVLLPVGLVRTGRETDMQTAEKKAEEMIKEVDGDFAAGHVLNVRLGVVVARKPL